MEDIRLRAKEFEQAVETGINDIGRFAAVLRSLAKATEAKEDLYALASTDRTLLLLALKKKRLNLVQDSGNQSLVALESMLKVVELCKVAVDEKMIEMTAPLEILEEVMESLPVAHLGKGFEYFEQNKEYIGRFLSQANVLKAFQLAVVRICNLIMRRARDPKLSGRVLLFLAHVYPLNERSGVPCWGGISFDEKDGAGLNLMQIFNDAHPTLIEDQQTFEEKQGDPIALEEVDKKREEGEPPVDYQLYRRFWGLQEYFRRPLQLALESAWRAFLADAQYVMGAFEGHRFSQGDEEEDVEEEEQEEETHLFVKFLTSSRLLGLQLNDAFFMRHVLMQFVVLFEYLVAQNGAKIKFTESKLTKIKELKSRVYDLLQGTPPEGKKFARAVRDLMHGERHWTAWKRGSMGKKCADFARAKAEVQPTAKPKSGRMPSAGQVWMAQKELSRLWNLGKDLEVATAEDRPHMPDPEQFVVQPVLEDADPDQQIEEQYRRKNDPVFAWKASRLLHRTHIKTITKVPNPNDLEQVAHWVRFGVGKEEQEQEQEEEEEEEEKDKVEPRTKRERSETSRSSKRKKT